MEGGLVTTGNVSLLGVNCVGAAAIVSWAVLWSSIYFFVINAFGKLRIHREEEFEGEANIKKI